MTDSSSSQYGVQVINSSNCIVNLQGVNWLNAYVDTTTYNINDAVSYNGSSYICITDGTIGLNPDISPYNWNVFAQGGDVVATRNMRDI